MTRPRCAFLVGAACVLALALSSASAAGQGRVGLAPGTDYRQIYRPAGPWAVHVVEADLSERYLVLRSLLGGGETMARSMLTDMIRTEASHSMRPVAAVNGDFFAIGGGDYAAIPLGFHVRNGELVTFPDEARSAFYVLSDGTAHIGRFRPNVWLRGPGDLVFPVEAMNRPPDYADLVLFTPRFGEATRADENTTHFTLVGLSEPIRPNAQIAAKVAGIAVTGSQPIPPGGAVLAARGVAAYALRRIEVGDEVAISLVIEPDAGEIREAIGGGPRLVADGLISVEYGRERFSGTFAQRRHPRTGLGLRDGTLVLLAVDGRQPGYSEGITLYQMAELFLELGCTDAMNLDGGGSTTMLVRDRVANSPSSGIPRAIANGLAIFSTAPVGAPAELAVEPAAATVLRCESVQLRAIALDEYHNPADMSGVEMTWECPPALGSVDAAGFFAAADVAEPTAGAVTARCGDLSATAVLRVVPAPARVVVVPESAHVAPGGVRQFFASAYDEESRPIELPEGRVAWSSGRPDGDYELDATGLLRAPLEAGRIMVVASIGEVWGEAEVLVGAGLQAVEDFERKGAWYYRGRPADVAGAVEWTVDPMTSENHCLRLQYDFSEGGGTRTADAVLGMVMPQTETMALRVYGDGKGTWLRARLVDAEGTPFAVDLAGEVTWTREWRWLTAELPSEAKHPITVESVYVAVYRDAHNPAGEVYLDDIGLAPAENNSR